MDQLSFRELLDMYLTWKGALGDPDQRDAAALLARRAYLSIWNNHPWNDHRLPSPVQITTVVSQRTYVLPTYFGRVPPMVKYISNLTTGARIPILSLDQIQQDYPEQGTTLEVAATPKAAAIAGMVGVSVQPSAAGQALEVVSDNVNDTDIRVLVEGLNSASQWDETQVTLNGTTAVAIGTWRDPILHFSKAYPDGTTPATEGTSSRGTVTLRTVAGPSTLQVLLPEESGRAFPSVVLYPKPVTAGEVYAIPTLRAPKRLLYDADAIPRYWGEALIERMKELSQVSDGDSLGDRALAGPEQLKLIALDNSIQAASRKRPFLG